MCGLKSKLNCPEFLTFLHSYDINCVQESRLDDLDKITVPGYKIFMHNRKKIARYRSGGIALLIKGESLTFIHDWFIMIPSRNSRSNAGTNAIIPHAWVSHVQRKAPAKMVNF